MWTNFNCIVVPNSIFVVEKMFLPVPSAFAWFSIFMRMNGNYIFAGENMSWVFEGFRDQSKSITKQKNEGESIRERYF